MKTLDQFIKDYLGKTIGYPTNSDFNGECLSLAKQYIKECFGFNPPPSGTNSAYGYWSNFPSPLGQYFVKVSNTPTGVPKRGDLVIWNTNAGNGYGHIAIFLEGTASSFKSLDQNWNGRETHVQGHYYTNVVGWLTPIMKEKTYSEAEMTAMRLQRDENWNKYTREISEHEATKSELDELRKSHNRFLETLASKLVCLADEANIIGAVERLLTVEDQLTECRNSYSKLETEKFALEGDKNREISKLRAELDELNEQLDDQKEQIERQQKSIKQLTERVDELLDTPTEKPISSPLTGVSRLIQSVLSIIRKHLWLK